jgi:hypothetical protein
MSLHPGLRPDLRQSLRRWRAACGQTTTEYLMISGFIVAAGLFVMRVMQVPFMRLLAQMTSYVLNNAADLPW